MDWCPCNHAEMLYWCMDIVLHWFMGLLAYGPFVEWQYYITLLYFWFCDLQITPCIISLELQCMGCGLSSLFVISLSDWKCLLDYCLRTNLCKLWVTSDKSWYITQVIYYYCIALFCHSCVFIRDWYNLFFPLLCVSNRSLHRWWFPDLPEGVKWMPCPFNYWPSHPSFKSPFAPPIFIFFVTCS